MKKGISRITWLKRKRKHGFLKRSATPAGRQILSRRRRKGRRRLAV